MKISVLVVINVKKLRYRDVTEKRQTTQEVKKIKKVSPQSKSSIKTERQISQRIN